MIKLKDLLYEQEVDKKPEHKIPSHFGSGKEITVKGYKTNHFDICASAVELFGKLDKVDNEEATKLIVEAAKDMDMVFQLEKAVVRKEAVPVDPIKKGIQLTNTISYKIGAVGKIIGEDLLEATLFIPDHVMVMVERMDTIKIEKQDD
tara:strand:- start:33 stop:476 length:444 start_codon:yes stop_codon:yes gene_type:complete